MHASIPTTYVSLIFLYILFFSLYSFFSFLFLPLLLSVPCSPFPPPFYCSQLPFFILSAMVGFTILTPQLLLASYGCPSKTAPLVCLLLSHYHCSKCIGCTTLHSQTKLLVLFLTSLYFSLPSSR